MSSGKTSDDQEDSKDNELRKKVEEQTMLKTARLTREKDSPFSIDLGDGREVVDKRPIKVEKAAAPRATDTQGTSAAKRMTIYQQARLNLLVEAFGIDANADGESVEYFRIVNGRELSLFNFAADDAGFAKAEAALRNAAEDMQSLLTARFGVMFSATDELIGACEQTKHGKDATRLSTRPPGLLELDALGMALSQAERLATKRGGRNLKVFFIDQAKSNSTAVKSVVLPDGRTEMRAFSNCMRAGHYDVEMISQLFMAALLGS